MTKKELGAAGEKIALNYLLQQGYFLLAKNFNTPHGEIDLIVAVDQPLPEIVFVEVKTRTNQNYGWPEEAVDHHKKSRLKYAAETYLQNHQHSLYKNYRFDVISVEIDLFRNHHLEHFKAV